MTYHVIPVNDLKPHTEDSTCECKPVVKFENGEMIVIHNSYDGREFKEQMIDVIKGQIEIDDLLDLLPT